MIWIVGTGRCGLKSCAVQLGGYHEPEPRFTREPAIWLHTGKGESGVCDVLLQRMSYHVISDVQHSFVIPLIRKVDPKAFFVWMIRPEDEFVRSFAHNWMIAAGQGVDFDLSRWMPQIPRLADVSEKARQFYRIVNRYIGEFLSEMTRWTQWTTNQLTVHENATVF